jgi:hypothetical protein
MKKCPQCGTTYTDESLRFCLADGAMLDTVNGEEPTVISGRSTPLRVDIASGGRSPVQAVEPVKKGSSALVKTLLILSILAAMAFVVIAASVGVLYFTREKITANNQINSTPTLKSSATPDPETEHLKNELANLQKQLDEKNSSSANSVSFPDLDDLDFEFRVATVNSPGDGFLALRSEPSSDYGERLAQIPHGAKINVVSCDSDKVTIGSRRGSWCLVEWSGRAGWVFDAWLTYGKN